MRVFLTRVAACLVALSLSALTVSADASRPDQGRSRASAVVAPVATRDSPPAATGPATPAPTPQASATNVPAGVAGRPVEADLFVTASRPLSPGLLSKITRTRGVVATELVDTGTVQLSGHHVAVLGVAPASFRRWTPTPTRVSDPLWSVIAGGQMSADFDVSKNLAVPLGSTQPVAGRSLRLGALAAMGIPGFDLTVNTPLGRHLGLTPRTGVLISAPTQDLIALRARLSATTPRWVSVALLRAIAPAADYAGSFLSNAQITAILRTAKAQVGKPYVWGATGPQSFDCSGLVGYAFAAAGIQLPRTSQQLWLSGPRIQPTRAQAGDLLFWANDPSAPTEIDHVTIYLGNGMMVSAPHTGASVYIGPIPSRNFRGLVRLDPRRAALIGGPQWNGIRPRRAA